MKTTPAPLKLALAMLLLSPVPAALAVPLGEVVSLSAIGEPLRVEIAAQDVAPDRVAACVRVSRTVLASDGLPVVSAARVAAAGQGADARIVVTNPAPMLEPAARLALEDVCETRLRREYVLLLPYPAASLPSLAPSGAAAASHALPASRAADGAATAPSPRASERRWVTAPGESPESLALALYPRDAGLRRRFVAALMRANPHAFPADASADAPVAPGTELTIPEPTRLVAGTRPSSSRPPRAAPPRAPRGEAAAKPARAPSRPAAPDATTDRLRLDGGEEAPPAGMGSGNRETPPTGDEAGRLRETQLVAAVDRSINMQLELMERIRRLEEIQVALKEQLDRVTVTQPADRATPRARPEAEQAPQPGDGDPGWIYTAGLLALAAALLAGALLLLNKRRTRRPASPPEAPAPAAEAWPEAALVADEARDGRLASSDEPTALGPGFSPLEWDHGPRSRQSPSLPPLVLEEEPVEEHDSAIELAEIMLGFGRVHGAAETLAEFIQSNPKQAVTPWLKLLEVYRAAGLRAEFDGLARQLNKTFNVKAVTWETFDEARATTSTLEQMPHVVASLQNMWGTRDCQAYLQRLLRDNRDGTREGFPLAVIDEILMLSDVLEQQLGPYRPAPGPSPAEDEAQRHAA